MVPEYLTAQFNVNEIHQVVGQIDNNNGVNYGPRTPNGQIAPIGIAFRITLFQKVNPWSIGF